MEKFTSVGDTAIHYTDSEKGEKTIVLLHGYLESLDVWDEFAPKLAYLGYRVITLDLPGHGISEILSETHTMEFLADTVKQLLDKLGVDKIYLVGHSMGGYAALAFAEKYPERLAGLVLFHSTPNADTEEKKKEREREIALIRAGRKELLSKTNPSKRFAVGNRRRLKDELESLSLQVMLTEDEGIVAILRGMMQRKDTNDMLAKLEVPQLFVFGRQDEHIPVETAEKVIRKNPQAQVAWLDNSGHMGFLEEPEESVRILDRFAGPASENIEYEKIKIC